VSTRGVIPAAAGGAAAVGAVILLRTSGLTATAALILSAVGSSVVLTTFGRLAEARLRHRPGGLDSLVGVVVGFLTGTALASLAAALGSDRADMATAGPLAALSIGAACWIWTHRRRYVAARSGTSRRG